MRRIQYLAISALVVLGDVATKWLVTRSIDLHESIPVIPGLFSLVHVLNSGAAFGLGASSASRIVPLLLNGGAIAVFGIVAYHALRTALSERRLQVAFHLILGGAVGNLFDRFRFGYVVDFLDFFLGGHHWPAFNVADAAICIGVALLFLDARLKPEGTAENAT